MKKSVIFILLCMIGFCFAAKDQAVTVVGFAKEKKPTKEAFEDALQDALVNAVEKNLGTWLKSQQASFSLTEANGLSQAKYDILSKSNDFVVNYKVLKRGLSSKGLYEVTVEVTISTDRLSAELRKYVGEIKSKMDNPSIAFVLTSWEKKGVFTTATAKIDVSSKSSYNGNARSSDYASEDSHSRGSVNARANGSSYNERDAAVSERGSGSASVSASEYEYGESETERNYNGSASYDAERNYEGKSRRTSKSSQSVDASYSESSHSARYGERNQSAQGNSEGSVSASASITTGKIDENMYAKFADMSIIDGFQQEFKEKGFDLKAADRAREIAVAPSALQTGININDRSAVRDLAEKEGANFVARGEVMLLGQGKSAATGQIEVTGKIGSEIIDVNSGDVVASYSNTVTVSNSNIDRAKAQLIKKAAVVAARTLASQTLLTWQERAEKGRQYTVEIRNMTKARSQKIPFEKAVKSIASISSQTSPAAGVQTYTLLYKGSKSDLGMAIIEAIGDAKGFSEEEFDGPNDENGKIVFTFTK